MADEYDGFDDEALKQKLEEATGYEERSKIRKILRERKKAQQGDAASKSRHGSAGYRRPGFQAPKVMTIPNSVTGNVLPDRVHMDKLTQKEKPQSKATISFLDKKTVVSPYPSARKSSATSGRSVSSPRASLTSPRGSVSSTRSSVSSITPEPTVEEPLRSPEPRQQPRTARVNGLPREPSPEPVREPTPEPPREPTPEPPREPTPEPPREPTPEPPREPTPEPPREPTPEPPREPTPEPPREPTPEPPREPTPEPPREPTPEPPREPTPEPPREPTPEPPREPTPEPPREPTPEPVKEPTPEPERSPTPPQKEVEVEPQEEAIPERRRARDEEESEDEEDEDEDEEDEETDEEEEESDEEHDVSYDERHEYRSGRSYATGKDSAIGLPREVMSKEEKGVRGGDFRVKLQKASETKIDTKAAFPQKKAEAVQLDFRTVLKKTESPTQKPKVKGGAVDQTDFRAEVLKKSEGPVRKQIRSGAAEQKDFRGSLKRRPKGDKTPEKATKPSRRREETSEEPQPEETPKLDETDSVPVPAEEKLEPSEYEARRLERQRRREQRKKELAGLEDSVERGERESQSKSPAPSKEPVPKSPPPPTKSEKPVENGTDKPRDSEERSKKETSPYDLDSYEARREARRKAREERLKAAAARVEEKQEPRLSYRERKAREQMQNAHDSRKKWENREEDSGDKEKSEGKSVVKKKDTATQQLLAWCQHKTKYYENVNVKDFRQSWSDGLAFCAIMHSFLPDKIPYDDLSADNPRKNFTIAFEAAKEAGIPEMLDVDDMILVKIPDAKSIMTFLVTIYQHFNS